MHQAVHGVAVQQLIRRELVAKHQAEPLHHDVHGFRDGQGFVLGDLLALDRGVGNADDPGIHLRCGLQLPEGATGDKVDVVVLFTQLNGNHAYIIDITGLEEGTYTFTEIKAPDGYNLLGAPIVVVIDSNIDELDPMPPYDDRDYDIKESIVDNYMWMETESGQRIAIHFPQYAEVYKGEYCKDADGIIEFVNFQSDALPDHITEIEFSGGILDYLFDCRQHVPTREGEDILTVIQRDRMEYTVPEDNANVRRKIIIGTREREVEINDFNRCMVKETYLKYQFETAVPLKVVAYYISLTFLLVRFMSNRYDVGFRAINVKSTVNRVRYPDGTVYFKKRYSEQVKIPDSCITFQDLGWTLINLLAIFTNIKKTHKRKGPDYALDFIPRTSEMGNTTNETICSISGSPEYEASQQLNEEELRNKGIKAFADAVLDMVNNKEIQQQYSLSEGAVNLIRGSINNWSLSARERFEALLAMFKDATNELIGQSLGREYFNIGKFVKHRNALMHDAALPADIVVRNTANVLRGLVYCSILNRAGLEKNTITKLCQEGRIHS